MVRIEANVSMDYKCRAARCQVAEDWRQRGGERRRLASLTRTSSRRARYKARKATKSLPDEVLFDECDLLDEQEPNDIFPASAFPTATSTTTARAAHSRDGLGVALAEKPAEQFRARCAPGAPVCGKDGTMVSRLQAQGLRPANHGDYRAAVPYENTLPLQETAWTLWGAWDIGLRMCWDRFCDLPPMGLQNRDR